MRDFIGNLGSLSWWFSVVLVGILINLAAAYLKPRIDLSWSDFYSRWRERRRAKQQLRDNMKAHDLTQLRDDSYRQVLLAVSLINLKLRLFVWIIFLFLVIATLVRLDRLLQPYTMGDVLRELVIGTLLVIVALVLLIGAIAYAIRIINLTSLLR